MADSSVVTTAAAAAPEKQVKFITKSVEMSPALEEQVVAEIVQAAEDLSVESEIATRIKQHMDSNFGSTWHCIVGASFGSKVSHLPDSFIYGDIEDSGVKRAVLLFKTD